MSHSSHQSQTPAPLCSFWKPGAAINRCYSLQMGISQRKSYLNSLSEQQAAREAESLGFSAPTGMPLPDSNASFAARRCMSWADTTTLAAESSQELGPDDSDEVPSPSRLPRDTGLSPDETICRLMAVLGCLPRD